MKEDYQEYRKLSEKQKKDLISNARQLEEYRGPNPQGDHKFNEIGFIDFKVDEDGRQIRLQTYRHQKEGVPTKAVIFILHGLNSHIGRAAHLANYYADKGYICVGFDHRGFGQSEGRKGFMSSLQSHLADTRSFIELVSPLYEGIPKFVMGESMGGMTAYYLTLADSKLFKGAILMAPALMNGVGSFLVGLAKVVGFICPKNLIVPRFYIGGMGERNPEVTNCNRNDPHILKHRASISTLQTLVRTLEQTHLTFPKYECPFVVVQGGRDKIVSPNGAFELYDKCSTPPHEKQLLFYEDMWHDVWHESEITEIMEKVLVWMDSR